MFGPNPKRNNKYVLLAKDWNKHTGQVRYDDKVWETGSGSAFACLMVDMDLIRETSYNSRTAEGRRIN